MRNRRHVALGTISFTICFAAWGLIAAFAPRFRDAFQLTASQTALLGTEGVEVEFTDDAIDAMAQIAYDVNRRTQNIGARRLYTILEKVFETVSFDAPDLPEKKVTIDATYVRDRLAEVLKDEDLSRFIL